MLNYDIVLFFFLKKYKNIMMPKLKIVLGFLLKLKLISTIDEHFG